MSCKCKGQSAKGKVGAATKEKETGAKMSDTVFLEKTADFRGEKRSSVPGFVKHVHCEGARFHVLWWDSTGRHCGVKNCVVNAPLESDE